MKRKEYNRILNEQIAVYRKMLDEHDWYYYQSDDRRAYEKGLESEKKLKMMAKKHPFSTMYESKKRKMIKNV